MMNAADKNANAEGAAYLNPVYNHDFPDPFVLKFCGEYWGYCTGIETDGRCFGLLHSTNLVQWQALGGAMIRLPNDWPYYWAPEVIYLNGKFYLYYSVGDEVNMQMRVAVATQPAGPFVDSGYRLTHEKFAIDGHVLSDEDGQRYLFYATDFLEHSFIGTGTVRDLMLDPFTLAGQPRPVTLPRYDWHIYDPIRVEKGGVRWHTIEGSFVLKHKGLYYQMFSGGNWQNPSYGVSYATTDSLVRSGEWEQVADGQQVLPILRTIPGSVIGPGHNSVVRGPDNYQLYCIYHRWAADGSARVLAIDPLDWVGERMVILGPSTTSQPIIQAQTIPGPVESGEGWHIVEGQWSREGNVLSQTTVTVNLARLIYELKTTYFLLEVNLRADSPQNEAACYGLKLSDEDDLLTVAFEPTTNALRVNWQAPTGPQEQKVELPAGFKFSAYHLLRLEVAGIQATLSVNEPYTIWTGQLALNPTQLELFTQHTPTSFAGVALTPGWEDLFVGSEAANPARLGWQGVGWKVQDNALYKVSPRENDLLTKGPLFESYELVVNAKLDSAGGSYGIYPTYTVERPGPLLRLGPSKEGWVLTSRDENGEQLLALPPQFNPLVSQQFRFRKGRRQVEVFWEQRRLGHLVATAQPTTLALSATARVSFDTVRLTAYECSVRIETIKT